MGFRKVKKLVLAFLLFPPAICHASPSPSDSLLSCQFHELAIDPPGARAAGKRLADLDVGEPRTVRLFYFLPNDRRLRLHVVQGIRDEMRRVQAWFGEQMEAHGFGYRTFRLETDDEGDPLVHLVDGQYPDSHYIDGTWALAGEIRQRFDLSKSISVLVIDNSNNRINRVNAGEATWWSKQGGAALVGGEFTWQLLAHELTHTFGIGHDFRDDRHIMSFGQGARNALSACSAGVLAVHPYFNPDVGVEWGERPTIERLSRLTYPEGSASVPIRLRLSDPDGLQQVRLRVPTRRTYSIHLLGFELKMCRGLMGETEAVVEIDYDGVIPSGSAYGLSDLSNPPVHPISITVLDTDGNKSGIGFDLWQLSRQHLATLEVDDAVHAVTFAPGGATLASASFGGTVLWDLETRTGTPSLFGGTMAVAISPDGATLASGAGGLLQLLDLEGGQVVGNLSGHPVWIRTLAFSPDGAMLASGAADGIRLWNIAAQTATATLRIDASSVAFSPDGSTLASGSSHGVRLWDLETQTYVAAYGPDGTGRGGRVNAVAFSPDGTLIASAWEDSTVRLWDVAEEEDVAVLEGHDGPVRSVAFSADGTLLASGADLAVSLWDPATKARLATLQGEGRGTNTVAFSPDGATLAAGTQDGGIGLWDIAEWRVPRPRRLVMVSGDHQQGAGGEPLADPLVVEVRDQYDAPLPGVEVTFAVTQGDGRVGGRFTLESTTADADGRVEAMLTLGPLQGTNVVEVSSPGLQGFSFRAAGVGELGTPRMEGDFHTWRLPHAATVRLGKGRIRTFAFSPNGGVLAVGTDAGIWLYDVATHRELALLPARRVEDLAFSPDGTTLASCGSHKDKVRLWNAETGHQMAALDVSAAAVAFSPDGRTLASGYTGIELWDVETGIVKAAISEPGLWGIQSVAFSPDGRTLAAGLYDHTVRLWDVETAAGTEIFRGHGAEVRDVSFSPDGRIVASASFDHTVRLWEVASGAVTTLAGHESWVVSLDFSPDGSTLASGSDDIKLWDLATGRPTTIDVGAGGLVAFSPDGRELASGFVGDASVALWDLARRSAVTLAKGHISGSSRSVALAPDGTTLAGVTGFDKVQLWDLGSATPTAILEGHTGRLNAVVFSPDGATLASASSDRTVKLWNVATGAELTTLEAPDGTWISAVALSPDGGSIASGDARGRVKVWDVASGMSTATWEGDGVHGVGSLAFSPDGTTLAAGSAGLAMWNLATGTSILTEKFPDVVYAVSFTPDGTALALARPDLETTSIWKVPPGTDRATLSIEYPAYVYTAGFSPDGSIVVSGTLVIGNVDVLEVRDVATGTLIATLEGHGGQIGSLAFSPDGSTFASGSADGTVLVWDLGRVLRHPRTVTGLSGDGQEGGPDAVLSRPFVIEVRDQNGDRLEGVRVLFRIVGGGGSLSVETSETDARGRAATTLTLGSAPGRNSVVAIVDDLESVMFTAHTRSAPTTLDKVGGDEQQGPGGSPLAVPLVVSLLDQGGSPMAGVAVTFAVTSGGGTLSATTATTDSQGRAASTLTLGRAPGANTVEVTVAGLAPVTFTAVGIAIPRTLKKLSGDGQRATGGGLSEPFAVWVLDQNGEALPGAVVAFAVTAGEGTLTTATDTTDAEGLASTRLTLGEELGPVTVEATLEGLEPVTFTATLVPTPDFDGDGVTGFSDFFLFAEAFGGNDPRFDLDGSGSVDFADFFLFAEHFGQPARAKLVALAQRLIGLPEGPGLQQNAPNPFNSQTVIPWFVLDRGVARLEVFALTGQRIAVLHDGPQEAGLHRLHWDGRDDQGRLLASGVYVYRLVTAGGAQTRKLTLLR